MSAGKYVKDGLNMSLEYIVAVSGHVRLARPGIPLSYVNESEYVDWKN
jgi:hypothetical protein